MLIRDGKHSDRGWKEFGSGINIPDPQHWLINANLEFCPTLEVLTVEDGDVVRRTFPLVFALPGSALECAPLRNKQRRKVKTWRKNFFCEAYYSLKFKEYVTGTLKYHTLRGFFTNMIKKTAISPFSTTWTLHKIIHPAIDNCRNDHFINVIIIGYCTVKVPVRYLSHQLRNEIKKIIQKNQSCSCWT